MDPTIENTVKEKIHNEIKAFILCQFENLPVFFVLEKNPKLQIPTYVFIEKENIVSFRIPVENVMDILQSHFSMYSDNEYIHPNKKILEDKKSITSVYYEKRILSLINELNSEPPEIELYRPKIRINKKYEEFKLITEQNYSEFIRTRFSNNGVGCYFMLTETGKINRLLIKGKMYAKNI